MTVGIQFTHLRSLRAMDLLWYLGAKGRSSRGVPTKELMNHLSAGYVRHGGDPVLRWIASNVTVYVVCMTG